MGIFKCDSNIHDKPFSCDTLAEWKKHMADHEHTTRGVAPCTRCGKKEQPVLHTGTIEKNAAAPALCAACAAMIVESIAKTKAKDEA